jgi:hypothetical protein
MNYFFVAGFDFGTSYSKVVIQEQLTKIQKVVIFDQEHCALFPSYVKVNKGRISGPNDDAKGTIVSYPKLLAADAVVKSPVFQSVASLDANELMSLVAAKDKHQFAELVLIRYFLSVIQGIHSFIQRSRDWSNFDTSTDPLVIQIAVPTGLMDKADRKVESLMRNCLCAATNYHDLHPGGGSSSTVKQLNEALDLWNGMNKEEQSPLLDRCVTYPEVAAGVQPILQSRNVREGKYITLDVGAGTIDLNVFHKWTRFDNDRPLDYWACEVKPLGFSRLEKTSTHAKTQIHEISVNTIPESMLKKQLETAIRSIISQAFEFEPSLSAWDRETFAYMWGGGSEHPAYGECFLEVMEKFNIGIHMINRLPVPNNDLTLPKGLNFGRIAIAYGLSYYHVNLRSIRLPSSIEKFSKRYGHKNSHQSAKVISPPNSSYKDCSCRGNPSCFKCGGAGHIKIEV